ncbi:MAG: hypothetical protein K7J46_07355 [Bryobacter sp.]|jgi:DNA-binding beta-propeller fold protein YncE|nr:hypothetical protein [Bryobacter sp. CoA8 C33]
MHSLWLSLVAASLLAQDLAVVEKKGHALGFYRASTGQRLAAVPLKTHPHELIFSPDGRFAFVTENGMLWMTDKGQGGNTIAIVDLNSRQLSARLDLGNNYRPHGMDLNPHNHQLVVTVEGPSGLLLIDTQQRKVLRRYDTQGQAPHMVTLNPSGDTAYVSNSGSGTLAAVHLPTGQIRLIPAGQNPQGSVFTPDAQRLYLTVMESDLILGIHPTSGKIEQRIPTSPGPARLAIVDGGKTILYNLRKGVAWADIATGKEITRLELPGRPLSMTLSRDGKTAYLSLQDEDQIAIVDIAARKITRYLKTPPGAGPDPVLEIPSLQPPR